MAFKKTASDMAIINQKYFGDEPVKFECTNDKMMDAFTWYNYMCSSSDAREYLVSYLVNVDRKAEAKVINSIKECWVPTTAGWTARIINNGNYVSDYSISFMNQKIKEAIDHKTEDDVAPGEKPNVQTYIKDKSNDMVATIEDMLDIGYDPSFSYYNFFKAHEVSPNVLRKVKEYYAPLLEEYRLIGKDKDLREGYKYLKPREVTARIAYLHKMISDIDSLIANKLQSRKKRVVKAKVKKINLIDFKYLKEDNELKLISIDPNKILDSKELWLYNTKINTLTVLYSDVGFSIKGTTILNITEKSVTKKIGKSSEKMLTRVMSDSRVQLRKLMGEIKSVASVASGRTNENVIVMRAF